MSSAIIGLLLAASQGTAVLPLREGPIVHDRIVRLGEIADLGAVPPGLREAAAKAFIIRMAEGMKRVNLTSHFVADRLRAQVPALAAWQIGSDRKILLVQFAPRKQETHNAIQCLVATHDVNAGEVLNPTAFEPATCATAQLRRATRYDAASKSVIAVRSLVRGEQIRRFAAYSSTVATKGSDLVLRSVVGHVVIERPVVAQQSANAGGRLFVRAKDGTILSARLADMDR